MKPKNKELHNLSREMSPYQRQFFSNFMTGGYHNIDYSYLTARSSNQEHANCHNLEPKRNKQAYR